MEIWAKLGRSALRRATRVEQVSGGVHVQIYKHSLNIIKQPPKTISSVNLFALADKFTKMPISRRAQGEIPCMLKKRLAVNLFFQYNARFFEKIIVTTIQCSVNFLVLPIL